MSPVGLHVRPAHSDDVAAIIECAKRAYAMYVERLGREPAPMLADFNRAVESDQVLVVCTQAEVAGYVVSYQRRDDLFIENIAVSPDFQRQGLADLMLDHLYQVATAAGCRNVVLYTNVKMTENLAWYAKRGYRETHRLHEDGFDRVYLCKNLQ